MKINPMLMTDMYKISHINMYPKGTEMIYSNLTSRGSRMDGVDHVVVFGIQYFIKEFLIDRFNEDFFQRPKDEVVGEYKRVITNALGKSDTAHIEALHDLGYLPIEIKALPEGSLCPLRVPLLTIVNTHKNFAWLTNYLETILSNSVWHPITVATIAHEYKKLLKRYAKETSDNPDFVNFQGHDFSMRGQTSLMSSMEAGAAHAVSFYGGDSIPAIPFLEEYYGAKDVTYPLILSVPASEHSVACLHTAVDGGEFDYYKNLITDVYPDGIISLVADSYDYWSVFSDFLPRLKDVIMARNGTVTLRGDSGDPVKIAIGDPDSDDIRVQKGSVELLWDLFGGKVNSKGYKEIDNHVNFIYGDSITLDRCEQICEGLKKKGFASTSMIYGIGSFTYQCVTRDQFSQAIKCTAAIVDGKNYAVAKDPKTDSGMKKSARGLLMVTPSADGKDYQLIEGVTAEQEASPWNCLKTVFRNSRLTRGYSLSEIRERLND